MLTLLRMIALLAVILPPAYLACVLFIGTAHYFKEFDGKTKDSDSVKVFLIKSFSHAQRFDTKGLTEIPKLSWYHFWEPMNKHLYNSLGYEFYNTPCDRAYINYLRFIRPYEWMSTQTHVKTDHTDQVINPTQCRLPWNISEESSN